MTRAFKAAKKAGIDVQIEVDLERKRMMIKPVKADETGNGTTKNDWDAIYEQN